ncbi:ribose-phosphate pyrophosphokinase 1 [Drechslerella stenobrocha 248]|uniref:Ribose-phosphate pyrophosphokinase 1 n=1 Tax=Drechslerella stenobrocha 248 TaxID=1043628 RepID=W7HL69_9PEZI|nr:ribose-phosphate pyrophosphokinase 1 [Drechslerella stenobrocha 248]
MRRVQIFSGSSNPALCDAICERLGRTPSQCALKKFSNGETSVQVGCSIRDQDVFIVQGGGAKVNDAIMETLILISACKGGSANKVTAVLPYFPYSKQSKKKSHRGAITARMLANLLTVAGVDHVITVDLHASQMKGFFSRPVDNLSAEPIFAKWIRQNVPNWREAVVVSKNPGGTKRVTSLADALKLNFALITTDKRRAIHDSALQSRRHSPAHSEHGNGGGGGGTGLIDTNSNEKSGESADALSKQALEKSPVAGPSDGHHFRRQGLSTYFQHQRSGSSDTSSRLGTQFGHRNVPHPDSHMPLLHSVSGLSNHPLKEQHNGIPEDGEGDDEEESYNDDQVSDVTASRLVQGHIVDDDYPSPSMTASMILEKDEEGSLNHMLSSIYSTTSSIVGQDSHALGNVDPDASDEDDDGQDQIERMIMLVGEVRNKTIFIVDDMIDRAGSWVAAAELAVKRCGAKKVYCIATHGLFGSGTLDEMDECKCIDKIVVTNSFPLGEEVIRKYKKLLVLDLSHLLSEVIRRNHHGETISPLYTYYWD